jgi:hypothetical protein
MMRHSPAFRGFSALIGLLFVYNFAQPIGMSEMSMNGMRMTRGASMQMAAQADGGMMTHTGAATTMSAAELAAHCADMLSAAGQGAPSHDHSEHQSSAPSNGQEECQMHECCASALVHVSLAPVTSLSWLPEHVISQETPASGDCVVETDGQLLLPFANGPPQTVIA